MNGKLVQDWKSQREFRLLPSVFKGMNMSNADESDRRSVSGTSSVAPISQFQGLIIGARLRFNVFPSNLLY